MSSTITGVKWIVAMGVKAICALVEDEVTYGLPFLRKDRELIVQVLSPFIEDVATLGGRLPVLLCDVALRALVPRGGLRLGLVLRPGLESGLGDNDYQDVVFNVRVSNDHIL